MAHEERDYFQILREQGYRVTPQRLTVLDAVCDIDGHPTISDIYSRVKELDPTIDQSTIYRALDVLCSVGLVVVSEIGDRGKVYKIAGATQHHHLVCAVCGAVLTIDNKMLQPLFEHIRIQYGFEVGTDHLALTGRCRQCRQ